jgi:hypothetical protein
MPWSWAWRHTSAVRRLGTPRLRERARCAAQTEQTTTKLAALERLMLGRSSEPGRARCRQATGREQGPRGRRSYVSRNALTTACRLSTVILRRIRRRPSYDVMEALWGADPITSPVRRCGQAQRSVKMTGVMYFLRPIHGTILVASLPAVPTHALAASTRTRRTA